MKPRSSKWLACRYGVSWQIIPNIQKLLNDVDTNKISTHHDSHAVK